jgi:hypothetical protein
MKYITLLKNKLFPKHQAVLLGRWSIVYCDKKINQKLDLSNEDHCGVCDVNKFNKHKEHKIHKIIFYENM